MENKTLSSVKYLFVNTFTGYILIERVHNIVYTPAGRGSGRSAAGPSGKRAGRGQERVKKRTYGTKLRVCSAGDVN